jgi:cobalt/nickel transport system ATP-binding protein
VETVTRLSLNLKSFRYHDGTEALSDINIEIKKGQFVGILGSNGSGKTTLLKVMDGLMKDFDGTSWLDGTAMKGLSPKEIYRKIGLIFQNPDDQLFAPTVFEDIAFGPINMGVPAQEIERRKRICIAGLLAMGHEILLLDEPTAGLDPMGEHKMMNLLTGLNREKKVTIVMATHSVDLVPVFLDHLYVLSKGRIVRGGSPEEVFTAPQDMAQVKLRLPQIAEMIYRLKHEDNLPFGKIPLTIGEARKEILKLYAF